MNQIQFPEYSGIRCLMMPYIQGDTTSLPKIYSPYNDILSSVFFKKGDIGFLTIDESLVVARTPHRGAHAKYSRALHTEVGKHPDKSIYCWGNWGGGINVTLDPDVKILLANNLDNSCAIWNSDHEDTSLDGDIGYAISEYPYDKAHFMKAGEVCEIGILTPHESVPVKHNFNRQFLRIVSSGIHGREEYFTKNLLLRT